MVDQYKGFLKKLRPTVFCHYFHNPLEILGQDIFFTPVLSTLIHTYMYTLCFKKVHPYDFHHNSVK